jgi:hypothetical protein
MIDCRWILAAAFALNVGHPGTVLGSERVKRPGEFGFKREDLVTGLSFFCTGSRTVLRFIAFAMKTWKGIYLQSGNLEIFYSLTDVQNLQHLRVLLLLLDV